mgnify:CR=1 FL=1
MLLGCGLMIVILAVFGDRLSSGWLFALVIGACVVPHLFMMRGHKNGHEHGDATPAATHVTSPTEDKPTNHKGGCCH